MPLHVYTSVTARKHCTNHAYIAHTSALCAVLATAIVSQDGDDTDKQRIQPEPAEGQAAFPAAQLVVAQKSAEAVFIGGLHRSHQPRSQDKATQLLSRAFPVRHRTLQFLMWTVAQPSALLRRSAASTTRSVVITRG